MLCPECHAEYLVHMKKCGDCNIKLVDACLIDISIPEINWKPLIPFEGKTYADMTIKLLDRYSILYYLKMDWASSAFGIYATSIAGQIVRIFVPENYIKKANELALSITGKIK